MLPGLLGTGQQESRADPSRAVLLCRDGDGLSLFLQLEKERIHPLTGLSSSVFIMRMWQEDGNNGF